MWVFKPRGPPIDKEAFSVLLRLEQVAVGCSSRRGVHPAGWTQSTSRRLHLPVLLRLLAVSPRASRGRNGWQCYS